MKTVALTLVVLGLTLGAVSAVAQDAGKTSYTLLSNPDMSNTWTAEGASGTNPDLTVPANTAITVIARNADGGVHNIKVGNGETKDIQNQGDEATVTFTSPASGTVQYVCTIHSSTMKGDFVVAGSQTDNGDGGNDAPGFGLIGAVLVLAGVAVFVARRK